MNFESPQLVVWTQVELFFYSSFKTEPYQIMDNAKLLQSEQNALFKVKESALTFNQGYT